MSLLTDQMDEVEAVAAKLEELKEELAGELHRSRMVMERASLFGLDFSDYPSETTHDIEVWAEKSLKFGLDDYEDKAERTEIENILTDIHMYAEGIAVLLSERYEDLV